MYQLLEKACKTRMSSAPLWNRKYGDFYACLHEYPAARYQKGVTPLKPALDTIAAMSDKKQLAASVLGKLEIPHTASVVSTASGWDRTRRTRTQQIAQASQGGLSLPDRDYYLQQTGRMQKIRQDFVAHMSRMFRLAGDSPEKAAEEAQNVMAIETALAQGLDEPDRFARPCQALPHHDAGTELSAG